MAVLQLNAEKWKMFLFPNSSGVNAFIMLSDGQVTQSLLGEKLILKGIVYAYPVPHLSTTAIHSGRDRAGLGWREKLWRFQHHPSNEAVASAVLQRSGSARSM